MMGLKGKLGTALLSASMLGMLIGTPVQAASSVTGKNNIWKWWHTKSKSYRILQGKW